MRTLQQMVLAAACALVFLPPVFAETIELVTYYPASASQGDLHVRSVTVGSAYSAVALDDGEAIIRTSLGIGPGFDTLAPAGPLHVTGEANTASNVLFEPGSGTGTIRLTIGNAGLGAPTGEGTTSNGDKLVLWNATAGTIHKAAIGLNNNQELWLQSSGNNANNKITFYTSNASTIPSERMRINASGNVGIGTAAPANKLSVEGPWTAGAGGTQMKIHSSGVGFPAGLSGLALTSQNGTGEWIMHRSENAGGNGAPANTFSVGLNGLANFLNITPAGNVGVGTTNPTSTLHVEGSLNATGAVTLQGLTLRPVYRLSLVSGGHINFLYTADVAERNNAMAGGWTLNGIAFYAFG